MNLIDALDRLGLHAEILMNGRWARIEGERCPIYVVEMSRHRGFFTWCDDADERSVEYYLNPLDAILSRMRRAGGEPWADESEPDGCNGYNDLAAHDSR